MLECENVFCFVRMCLFFCFKKIRCENVFCLHLPSVWERKEVTVHFGDFWVRYPSTSNTCQAGLDISYCTDAVV